MRSVTISLAKIGPILILILGLSLIPAVWAQEGVSEIIITDTDESGAPIIELQLYAKDSSGNFVALEEDDLEIRHAGDLIGNVELVGTNPVGTLAIFVVDIPEGVSSQIPTIQDAIKQYASEANMVEQVDYAAVFRVDELAAAQILAPSEFFNTIANTFANPLQPTTGATALIDSIMGILNNMNSVTPDEALAAHIIVFSDGTDVVSTQYEAQDLPKRAAELGIPVHTVLLENEKLSNDRKQEGREYLSQIAAGTGGRSLILSTPEDLAQIWEQISSFRDHQVFHYTIDQFAGGEYDVEVGLADNPQVIDSTTVSIPPGAPSITIDLPPESRQLTLQNLDAPVPLSFATTASWLDGVERQITKAQLIVNGLIVQDIEPTELENFEVEISNFTFGDNRVQIAIVDDQGSRGASPEVILTISQGETEVIPEEIEPAGLLERLWARVRGLALGIGGCLLVIVMILVIFGLYRISRGSSLARSAGLQNIMYRIPFLRRYASDARRVESYGRRASLSKKRLDRYTPEVRSTDRSDKRGGPSAYLEVVESVTQHSTRIDLTSVEIKIGRSSKQSDVVFNQDATVSRIHATIVQEGNDYRVFDEQSTSGTFVNEQRVPEYGLQLVDGDELRLGGVILRFRNL